MSVVEHDAVFLSDEEIAALGPDELAHYENYLETLASAWTLTPVQQRAEDLAGVVDELLYGGAAGGGKTEWMLWHAWHLSVKYEGHKTLALRRTLPQLKDSLIQRSLEKFDSTLATYKVGEKEWVFKNGSRLRFGFCDTDEDVRHYLSTEYDLIMFEELTEFSERQYTLVRSRARTTARKRRQGIKPHVISATNPGQVGHVWVKRHFVSSTGYGSHLHTYTVEAGGLTQDRTVAFVPAKVTDNPHIDPEYVFNLASLSETEKRQYLYGDWDTFEGQFFDEWRHDLHVIKPFVVPPGWPRIRGIDYGFAAPYSCHWIAFNQDGRGFVYREQYDRRVIPTEQARRITKASTMVVNGAERPEKIDYTVLDPSCWASTGTGLSVATQYRAEGLICRKAMNARKDGWARVREYLKVDPETNLPGLSVFSNCENLIRTLPEQLHDKDHPEDLDTTGEDHAVDGIRYALMSRPAKFRPKITVPDSLEERLARQKDKLAKRRKRGGHNEVIGRPVM